MSSILTNNGAMVALQTLKQINNDLGKTQALISTGKSVANAKDNSAVWAISKVMEADVKGFKAISDSLSLGESTVAVARQAAESITELLTDMKGKIVSAQESNVDRTKIQTDIAALTRQIESVVGAAQFNGLNLLNNRESAATYALINSTVRGSGTVDVLSSLNRSGTGVKSGSISVAKQDLGTQTATVGNAAVAATAVTGGGVAAANGGMTTWTVAGDTTTPRTSAIMAGDGFSFTMTGINALLTTPVLHVARDGDNQTDVVRGIVAKMNYEIASKGLQDSYSVAQTGATFTLTNNTAAATTTSTASVVLTGGGKAGGGLELLGQVNVATKDGAKAALSAIEGLIQTSIDSAATFGSAQGRIAIQADFVGKLSDSMKSGIGAMVDANMEEASARLQALQVQQQLGVQSLSIANQAPQSILSLFR